MEKLVVTAPVLNTLRNKIEYQCCSNMFSSEKSVLFQVSLYVCYTIRNNIGPTAAGLYYTNYLQPQERNENS